MQILKEHARPYLRDIIFSLLPDGGAYGNHVCCKV